MSSPTPAVPTLEEVARRAGVSRATVSRVINDSPKVSPQARQAVLEAVAELQYVPNSVARSLVRRRTDTLALVLSEPDTRLFSDPFFASIVRGVSAALADTERNLVLLTARDRREQEKVGRYVMQGHVDGVVFISLHREDVLPGILDRTGVPVVLSGRPLDGRPAAYVDADNVGGGRAATEHLLGIGRRVVATVTGPADMAAGIDRHAGHLAALEAAGLPARDERVEAGDFTEHGGRRATEALLARVPDLDALFVASDPMASGRWRPCVPEVGGCRTTSPSSASTTRRWLAPATRRSRPSRSRCRRCPACSSSCSSAGSRGVPTRTSTTWSRRRWCAARAPEPAGRPQHRRTGAEGRPGVPQLSGALRRRRRGRGQRRTRRPRTSGRSS
jgi:DNA-binding LacI/PurR family transcriptional regulator